MARDVIYDVVMAVGDEVLDAVYNLSKPVREIFEKVANKVEDEVYDYLSKIKGVENMKFDDIYGIAFRMYRLILLEKMRDLFESELECLKNSLKKEEL